MPSSNFVRGRHSVAAEIYLQWGKPVRKTSTPILYPVEVFAVLAPNTRHHINVFQEAVLGLLATGRKRPANPS